MSKTNGRTILSIVLLIATTSFALSAPSFASASEILGSGPCDRIIVLREASEIFSDLAGLVPGGSQEQFDGAMRKFRLRSPSVDSALPPVGRQKLHELVDALSRAVQVRNRSDVRLYAIETYQFLVNAYQKESCASPEAPRSKEWGSRK